MTLPTKPSPVERDPAADLARLATVDPRHLYQREKRASDKRLAPVRAAERAAMDALHAKLKAEEAEAKKGGRPRKGIGAGHNVIATKRKSRARVAA